MLEGLPKETTYSIMMPESMRDTLVYVATCLHGNNRRIFMAKTFQSLGVGGQRGAEQFLGWNRKTIRKGMHELQSGICCIDNFSGRGRKPIEYNLPKLSEDIEAIVKPEWSA